MTVWVARGWKTRAERYHTDGTCPHLLKANNIEEVEREDVPGRTECAFCDVGTPQRSDDGWLEWNRKVREGEIEISMGSE